LGNNMTNASTKHLITGVQAFLNKQKSETLLQIKLRTEGFALSNIGAYELKFQCTNLNAKNEDDNTLG